MMEVVVSGDNWSYKTCKAPVKSSPTTPTTMPHRHTSDNTDTQTHRQLVRDARTGSVTTPNIRTFLPFYFIVLNRTEL